MASRKMSSNSAACEMLPLIQAAVPAKAVVRWPGN